MKNLLENQYFKKLSHDIFSAIIAGISLSFLFFIFSDFMFKAPNLNGKWLVEIEYEKTERRKFQDLSVVYEVMLYQKGNEIYGTGEKVKETEAGKAPFTYPRADRVRIEIEGYLENNYLAKDKLIIHYTEAGQKRESSTFHDLVKFNEDLMSGNFSSTIANTTGPTVWTRLFPVPK